MWVNVCAENQRKITSEWKPATVGNGNVLQKAPCSHDAASPVAFSLLTVPCILVLVPSYLGMANVVRSILNTTFHTTLYCALCDLHSGLMLSRRAVHAAVVSSQITCFPRSNAVTITLTVRCRIVPCCGQPVWTRNFSTSS